MGRKTARNDPLLSDRDGRAGLALAGGAVLDSQHFP
jgi:hypothetical protein